MAWGVVGVMIIAVALSGCGSSPPATGIVTGRVAACTAFSTNHPTTVYVYKDQSLVATQRLPHAGLSYRFSLPVGRYLVKGIASTLYPVVVSKGAITRTRLFLCL